MSLGTQFLKRLTEGKKEGTTGQKPAGFDAGTEAAKRRIMTAGGMEKNYGDKIAELLNMCGVAGLYIKKQEVIDSIVAAGKTMQTSGAGPQFLRLHAAVKAASGMTMEARNTDLTGGAFQQLMEEVLVSLGAPIDLVGSKAKAAVKTAMRSIATKFATEQTVVKAFSAYAIKVGIRIADEKTGATKGKLGEAVGMGTVATKGTGAPTQAAAKPARIEAGVPAYVEAVRSLLSAFGVPEATMKLNTVMTAVKRTAMKDASSMRVKVLISKLTTELGKKD